MPRRIMEVMNWRVRRVARAIVPVKPVECQYWEMAARWEVRGDGMVGVGFCICIFARCCDGLLVVMNICDGARCSESPDCRRGCGRIEEVGNGSARPVLGELR